MNQNFQIKNEHPFERKKGREEKMKDCVRTEQNRKRSLWCALRHISTLGKVEKLNIKCAIMQLIPDQTIARVFFYIYYLTSPRDSCVY